MQLKPLINKIVKDEYGRPSAIIAVNKKQWESSHDLVNQVRKQLNFRKVGHGGALDVFATGLMLILVGKYTKLSQELLNLDKSYEATIVFGIGTDSQDIEGSIIGVEKNISFSDQEIARVLKSFIGEQRQYVSLFSSTKVNGNKLRVLMRDQRYKHNVYVDNEGNKHIKFVSENPDMQELDFEIPSKQINIYELNLLAKLKVNYQDLDEKIRLQLDKSEEISWQAINIQVKCSKGTYIRQLAEDIGVSLGCYAMLNSLKRLSIGDVSIDDSVAIQDLV